MRSPKLKAWKREQLAEWLTHRMAKQLFNGDAEVERKTFNSLTTEQIEFVLFVARLSYAKGHKDGREIK